MAWAATLRVKSRRHRRETMAEFFEGCQRDPEGTWPYKPDRGQDDFEGRLNVAMRLANRRIREAAEQDAKRKNMGTTGVVAVDDRHRGLRRLDGRLARLPLPQRQAQPGHRGSLAHHRDDSSGQAQPPEVDSFQYKNVITRAMGPSETVKPDVRRVDMQPAT